CPVQSNDLADRDRAQPRHRPFARPRAEPAHGPDRGGGRARGRQADRRRGTAERAGAGAAAILHRWSCWPRTRGVARRVLRRQHLRRACRTHERAARHHEELDPAGDDQIEGLSGAMTHIGDQDSFSTDELQAAEYALGVLAGTDRTAAAQRVARDRAFAALVAAWEERLAPWTAELPEVAPPPQVWERIAAQLSGAQRQRPRFWQSLMFWRGFGIVSALAAACL